MRGSISLAISILVLSGCEDAASPGARPCNSDAECGVGSTCLDNVCTVTSEVPWSALTDVPNGLDDGDDDTRYTAGTGLSLTGTTFALDTAVASNVARLACYDTPDEVLDVVGPGYSDADAVAAVEAGDRRINGAVNATTFRANDGTVRTPSELVYRGNVPVWAGEVTTIDSTTWQRVTPRGICLKDVVEHGGCYDYLPRVQGSVRKVRFTVLYTDNVTSCTGDGLVGSYWTLAHEAMPETTRYAEWSLKYTWSGNELWHVRTSPWFDASILQQCTVAWDAGGCAIFAHIPATCAGRTVKVRSVQMEYYDCLNPCTLP